MGHFLNEKRLQNYPRLIFIAIWLVMMFNLIFHQGWSGGFGGVIGVDFISYYSGGLLYRLNVNDLYSIPTQYEIQQGIFQQDAFLGQYNTYVSPPYVALLYAIFSYLPIGFAFALWTILSILAGLCSVYLIEKFVLPPDLKSKLPFFQLNILVFGFPPTVLGLMFGQNHLITFLLLTAVLVLSLKKRWFYAGMVLGLLIYKPHLVIGFLLVFLFRKRISALFGFGLISVILIGAVVLQHGIQPFLNFFNFINTFISNYYDLLMLEVAVFTLVTSTVYPWVEKYLNILMTYWIIATSILFSFVLVSKKVRASQYTGYTLAILFIFIVSPHVLITDMLPMILILLLLAIEKPSQQLVYLSVIIYLSTIVLSTLSRYVGVSLLGLIPVYLAYLVIRNLVMPANENTREFVLI